MRGELFGRWAVALIVLSPAQAMAKDATAEVRAWAACLEARASAFALQPIPPETAATAAMGACQSEEEAVYRKAAKTPFAERLFMGPRSMNRDYVDQLADGREKQRRDFREQLIALIVEARARPSSSAQ